MASENHSGHMSLQAINSTACYHNKVPAEKINKNHLNRSNCFEGMDGLLRQKKEDSESKLWAARTLKATQPHFPMFPQN